MWVGAVNVCGPPASCLYLSRSFDKCRRAPTETSGETTGALGRDEATLSEGSVLLPSRSDERAREGDSSLVISLNQIVQVRARALKKIYLRI